MKTIDCGSPPPRRSCVLTFDAKLRVQLLFYRRARVACLHTVFVRFTPAHYMGTGCFPAAASFRRFGGSARAL
eukprot:323340-Lingulodinium_polyedra.AAC.1